MTRDETIKVLALLKAAYPSAYRNMTKDEANGTIVVWATQFVNTPVKVVMIAVQKLIATNTFPPSIAEVKSKLRELYWEIWSILKSVEQGFRVLSVEQQNEYKALLTACRQYNDSGSNEPTLDELLSTYSRKYLVNGD